MRWPVYNLSQLVERFISGGTPSTKVQEYWSGEIPWITGADIADNRVILGRKFINPAAIENSATNLVPRGSILMVTRTGVGKIAIAPVDIAISQDITGIILRPGLLARYLMAAIVSEMAGVVAAQRGATIKGVTRKDIENVPILLPPPSEQRRIVEILDQADALRRKRAEADAKAARILSALFNKLFGDPGKNPKGWETTNLGDVAIDLRYGTSVMCSAEKGDWPVLRIPNVVTGQIRLDDLKYTDLPEDQIDRLLLRKGDVLFVRTNGNPDYVGRCAVFELGQEYLFASYLIRARLDLSRIDPKFLCASLATPMGRQAMAAYIRTTAGQSNISTAGLRQIPIIIPNMDIQTAFRRAVDGVEAIVQQRTKSKQNLERLFQGLLFHAFAGNLTAKWRQSHMKELLAEMEVQAKVFQLTDN